MNNKLVKKSPRILYFCSSSVFGGAERFVETCLEEHRAVRDESYVYFLNAGHFSQRLQEKSFHPHYNSFNTRLSNPLTWIRFQFHFYKFLKSNDITHIHVTMAYSQIFAAIAARLAGVKILWFQHGPIGGIIDRVANLLPYDHLLFNSSFTRDTHQLKSGKIKSPHTIIKLAVNTSFDAANILSIQKEYPSGYFVSMGRICRWKGYEVAIKAFKKNKTDTFSDKELLIIGSASTDDDKVYEQELKRLCADLGIQEEVHFLGFKPNVFDYLKASEALIHCSTIAEPFGLVVSEAIGLGVYVYATNLGGVIDQVTDKRIGFLYDSEKLLVEGLNKKYYLNRVEFDPESEIGLSGVKSMMDCLNRLYKSL